MGIGVVVVEGVHSGVTYRDQFASSSTGLCENERYSG